MLAMSDRMPIIQNAQLPREIHIAEGDDAIALVADDWHRLVARGVGATPFQSFAFASEVAAAHLRRGETPRIVTVRRGGQPILIFPTVITTFMSLPVIRFLGDPLIQYGDVLVSPRRILRI